jgi:transcriptional regulator with XRE-family HTH domain
LGVEDRLDAYLQNIAERLRLARWRAGLTQEAVAGKAGVTHRYYADLEAGRRNATLDTMLRVAAALGVPVGLLLDEEPDATWPQLKALRKANPQPLPLGRKPRTPRQ